ncbi:cobyrinate a,c-diamide synthase [Methanobrevibacter curvatus]|uniref:Cobyrinate a,c-diamide synthase n=1 Tax=Methanobrevibacter curvatus TaxID=49547 RepID=A0A165ZTK2_9EURY|nr:cobyrinate a,c-diamide synthase [Methanobrevibacter curvatus]KZX11141.1 cobyrinic acid A,C-diamide synthase [Methanobrevibacter curvatus]
MKLLLAGTGSAVGKTTISTGIMKALSYEMNVQPFKVGPDYIDPTYHSVATGNPSRNLDSFFMNDIQIQKLFKRGIDKSKSKIGVIEGVRGLYEGISPIEDVGNSASIAKVLDAPVVLIMDGRSLVKSAAAVVLGFKNLDPEINIQGVILNKIKGKKHYLKAKEAIEKLTDTVVVGAIPRDNKIATEERHLGLVPALERDRIKSSIDLWGEVVSENLDLDLIKEIAKNKDKLNNDVEFKNSLSNNDKNNNNHKKYHYINDQFNKNEDLRNNSEIDYLWKKGNKISVKIAVALDEVFTFYYKENLEALEENNAKIIPFSPLKDEAIPDADGVYIGGGYPEVFKKELGANSSMRDSIKKFHNEGNPIYGECGGLIYLSQAIDEAKMCNVVPHPSVMTDKVQGLSYVIAESKMDSLIANKGELFRGHEFHYTKLNTVSGADFAFDIKRGRGIVDGLDGIAIGNTLANYIHIHACSCPNFAYNFTCNVSELEK